MGGEQTYHIAGNFRGRKISRITYNKLFREINFEVLGTVSWLATPIYENHTSVHEFKNS